MLSQQVRFPVVANSTAVETRSNRSPEDLPREKILRATLRLLEEQGYDAVTTGSIAAEARVSKTTIYRHWASKAEVVVEAARLRFGRVEVDDLGSFEREIGWILEHRLADYRQPGTLRLVGSLVGASTGDPQLKVVFEDWIEQFSEAIHRATQRGIARGDVNPEVDTFALESLAAGVVARTVITQTSFPPATVDELAGLIAAAARGPAGE